MKSMQGKIKVAVKGHVKGFGIGVFTVNDNNQLCIYDSEGNLRAVFKEWDRAFSYDPKEPYNKE